MGILLNWLASAVIILIAAYVLPGVHVENFWTALVVAVILGILNLFVKPLLILLTLPITLVTFGLFLLVINAILILIAGSIVPGFTVDGFWWALLFSLLVSIINAFTAKL
jgi:putative membrane protein